MDTTKGGIAAYTKGQRNPAGFFICGAPQTDGQPCPSTVLLANGRCERHQFWELGDAPPELVRYGPDLPHDVLGRMARGLDDEQLLELRAEVLLWGARMGELAAQLTDGYAGNSKAFSGLVNECDRALKDCELSDEARQAWERVRDYVDSADRRTEVWRELERTTKMKAALSEQQTKRETLLEQYIPVARMAVAARAMSESMRRILHERFGPDAADAAVNEIREDWSSTLTFGSRNG